MLALAVVAGVIAVSQRGQAREATVAADAQRVGAEALGREQLDQALLLARAGVELQDSLATRGHLLSVLSRTPAVIGVLQGDGWPLNSVAVSPDGRLAAIGDDHGAVTVFDAESRRPIGAPYRVADGNVGPLAFSPDGATLGVSMVRPSGPVVDLIDPRTRKLRLRIALDPSMYGGASVGFLPDGHDLLVEQILNAPSAGTEAVLRRFDGTTGAAEGRSLPVPRASFGLTTTADRRHVFVTSRQQDETVMIDSERLRRVRRWPVGDDAGGVSPDGRLFALGSSRGEVRVLDLRSGRVRRFTGGKAADISRLAFTPDRRTLVTSHDDGQLLVWDVARGQLRERLRGHDRGHVWGLQIAADGRTLYSVGQDERALVWDLAGDRRLIRPFDAGPPFLVDPGDRSPRGIAVSPDGRTVAVTQTDGSVDLIDAQTLRPRRSVHALDGFAAAVAFSPDGQLLAIAGKGGQVTLRDARTLQPAGDLSGLSTTSQALAFSPDGSLLAAAELGTPTDNTASDNGTVRVWDVRRRALTAVRFAVTSASVAFSPDGTLLAAAALQRPTEVRDARTGRLVARLHDARRRAFAGVLSRRHPARYRAHGWHGAAVVDAQLEAGRAPLRGPRRAAVPVDAVHPRRPGARHLRRRRDGSAARRHHREPHRNGPHGRTRHVRRRRPRPRRLATVRRLRPASRPPHRHLPADMETTRLPRRESRPHIARVAGRAARPAPPNRLPARLTPHLARPPSDRRRRQGANLRHRRPPRRSDEPSPLAFRVNRSVVPAEPHTPLRTRSSSAASRPRPGVLHRHTWTLRPSLAALPLTASAFAIA